MSEGIKLIYRYYDCTVSKTLQDCILVEFGPAFNYRSSWIPKAFCKDATKNSVRILEDFVLDVLEEALKLGGWGDYLLNSREAEKFEQGATQLIWGWKAKKHRDTCEAHEANLQMVYSDADEIDVSNMVSRKKRTVGACMNDAESVDCSHMKGAGSKHSKISNSWHPETDEFGGF